MLNLTKFLEVMKILVAIEVALSCIIASIGIAGERRALIISNSGYEGVATLHTPANDADSLATALSELNFLVVRKRELDLAGLEDAVSQFWQTLGPGDVAWFYYSGLGVELRGVDYLIPLKTKVVIGWDIEADAQAMDLSYVLEALKESRASVKVVVTDCCRENPIKHSRFTKIGDGLAAVSAPERTIIAFPSAPKTVSQDGAEENSPYCRRLIRALRSRPASGLELSQVFLSTARDAKRESGQEPLLSIGTLLEPYFLIPPSESTASLTTAQSVLPESSAVPLSSKVLPKAGDLLKIRIASRRSMDFRWCPPGQFIMGSPPHEPSRGTDETQHRVCLSRGFWMGQFEVTQGEYESIAGRNPSCFKPSDRESQSWIDEAFKLRQRVSWALAGSDRLPVERINWNDAEAFMAKLNEQCRAQLPPDYHFSLPTEAQWEYACRAGTTTPFFFGFALNGDHANCNGEYPFGTETKGPNLKRTTKVGSHAANPWGLQDMHGNVFEWCLDWHSEDFYKKGTVVDPLGPSSGTCRVIRGGSWQSNAYFCRSAIRGRFPPETSPSVVGFRVAIVPTP